MRARKPPRPAHAWLDDMPDRNLHALVTCCELPEPEEQTRDAALQVLRHTDKGRLRVSGCKYKAHLPNFVHLVTQEGVRWYTSMQKEGKNRPARYRPRETIRAEQVQREHNRVERERARAAKEAKRNAAATERKQVAKELREEKAARKKARAKLEAIHEKKLRTLTGIRLSLYCKEKGIALPQI
jgi:hypothetical protein